MFKRSILIFLIILFSLMSACSAKAEKLDFVDANLIDVLRILAQKAGLDLVVSSDAGNLSSKKVTLHLANTSYLDAVDYVLRANGFSMEKENNIVLVSLLPIDQRKSAYKTFSSEIELKHISAEEALKDLSKLLPEAMFIKGERANSLIVKGKASDIKEAERLVSLMDKPIPQILIESKVVEVSESGLSELGISFGSKQGGFKFSANKETGVIAPVEDLLITLNALVSEGKANIIASPKISTLDDHEAKINIGSRVPYAVPTSTSGTVTEWSVRYIDAGVSLKITPRLQEDGLIVTKVFPEVSSISEWRRTQAGEFPVITTRNAEAMVKVKDGETIVIGGLINEADRENISKLPILGDVPVVGGLFQNRTKEKEKTEIIFLITPRVMK